MLKTISKLFVVFCLAILITACSGEPEKQVELPAKKLYEIAKQLENEGETYKNVSKAFSEVERQHPQSEYAKKAIIDLVVYAYETLNYDDAILNAENFLNYNPNHEQSAKIMYIRALSYYEQIVDIGRDQGNTTKALQSLNDVIISFPNSNYAINAKYKIDLARDHLAGKELDVGRFYQKNGDYQAAISRFTNVINQYSETSQTPEALARLVETYLKLGLYDQAYKYGAILGYNHQGSDWYQYAYDLLQKHKQ